MKRSIWILNAVLLVLVALLGVYLRQRWISEQERERKIRTAMVKAAAVAPPPVLNKVKPLDAPAYSDVALKNLFSADRSPDPIPDPPPPPPPPKPMPPVPSAHGVMLWEGLPPTVVLSLHGNDQKSYHPGDKVGEFTLVSVNNKEIEFEWDGKKVTKRLDEIMEKNLIAAANAAAANTPVSNAGPANQAAAVSPPKSGSLSEQSTNLAPNETGPGPDTGGGIHSCGPGDTSPPGTVVNGLKKLVNTTPFGVTCRWEPVK